MMVLSAEDLVKRFEELYPDKMHVQEHSDFQRGKDAGKVELIREIKELIDENSITTE